MEAVEIANIGLIRFQFLDHIAGLEYCTAELDHVV